MQDAIDFIESVEKFVNIISTYLPIAVFIAMFVGLIFVGYFTISRAANLSK